jgi:hypothetical protein
MSGPTIEICLDRPADEVSLATLDEVLERASSQITRTRKGRVWSLWIGERPYHVSVDNQDGHTVDISAGCNSPEDHENLTSLAQAICNAIGGIYDSPSK